MAKAKPKIGLPPRKDTASAPVKKAAPKVDERKIQDVINKGGSTTKAARPVDDESFKNINIKILESELKTINDLREKRGKKRGAKRLVISLHDWVVEAVQEKIERERKNYKV